MKTSTILITAAVSLFLASLLIYDLQLKGEYKKGNYKDPFRNFVTSNQRDFKVIRLRSATAVNVMVEQGPFKIMVSPDATDFVKMTQQGDTLTIEANFKYNFHNVRDAYVVHIACPDLTAFITDAQHTVGHEQVTDKTAREDFNWRPSLIKGFTSDRLDIIQDHASNVVLEQDSITVLNAIAGLSPGSASNLTIGAHTYFGKANLDIRHNSRLWVKEAGNSQLDYHIDKDARIIVNGASQRILKLTQP